MGFIWRTPSLTSLEVLWRWMAIVPMGWLAWHIVAPRVAAIPLDTRTLASMTFFEPVRSVSTLVTTLQPYLSIVRATAWWFGPLALAVWAILSAWGRSTLLRRAEPSLHSRFRTMLLFRLLRSLAFLLLLLLWACAIGIALRLIIVRPGQQGTDPNLVLFTAVAVGLTLAVFMLWSLMAWRFDLPPLVSMAELRLPETERGLLRSKLVETNLVMGIVRVALFVLAMTFSASPLPFQSQETQAYINVWWVGVAVFYVLSSDFFHAVRTVTYLRLLESLVGEANAPRPIAS